MFEELTDLEKDSSKRVTMPKNAVCYVCGTSREETRIRRYNEYCFCEKHYAQLEKYHRITDSSPRKHKIPQENRKCCICGELKMGAINGRNYCRKHYIQMSRHGRIFDTIYTPNEWVDCGEYYECILKDTKAQEVGRTKIDKEDYELLKEYKLYRRNQMGKHYVAMSVRGSGKKYFLHRFLMGIHEEEFTIRREVDHINGDSLDNRKCNLRICTHHQNSKNIRKKDHIVGVKFIKSYNGTSISKWTATIMHNYRTIYLGYFDDIENAILARITKEKELFGEYGSNSDLYYILDHPSPIEEITRILSNYSRYSLDGA